MCLMCVCVGDTGGGGGMWRSNWLSYSYSVKTRLKEKCNLFPSFIFGHAGSLLLCGLFPSCGELGLPFVAGWGSRVHGLSCSVAGEILLDQGSNLCLLNWQVDSLLLSRQGPYKTRS